MSWGFCFSIYRVGLRRIDDLAKVLLLRPGNNTLRLDPLPPIPASLPGDPITGNTGGSSGGGGQAGSSLQLSYYLYDHLGNTRIVFHTVLKVDEEDPTYVPEYLADYYPYGKILREWRNCTSERYLTTQHERDIETGYDYRGARFYDADLGRFLSVDPMAAEYAAWSTYNYVLGNPVRLVDPTGAKIEIPIYNQTVDEDGNEKTEISYIEYTPGMQLTGQKYADAVIISLNGLIEKGADANNIILTLASDETLARLREIDWTERNGSVGGIIDWSAEGGLIHEDGVGKHSPAVSLLHELGHVYYQNYDFVGKVAEPSPENPDYLELLDAFERREKAETGDYHNYEDKWVIERVEQPAAQVLGQSKRYSHTSQAKYRAQNPFSILDK